MIRPLHRLDLNGRMRHHGIPAWRCRDQLPALGIARRVPNLKTLPADVLRAYHLVKVGDPATATTLLSHHLDPLEHDWLPDDPVLIDAYTLYATLIDDARQLRAARYAAAASRRLCPPHHPRRLAAARVLGTALHTRGRFTEAAAVRQDLLTVFQQRDVPTGVLTTATELADSLHAGGHCGEAARVIDRAWRLWRTTPGADTATGQAVLHTYLHILRGCARLEDVMVLLTQITDDPAGLTLSERTREEATAITHHQRHVCARLLDKTLQRCHPERPIR